MKKLFKIILFIVFLPISVLVVIWKSKKMKPVLKIILSAAWIGLLVAIYLTPTTQTTPTPTAEPTAIPTAAEAPVPTDTVAHTATNKPEPTKEVISIDGEDAGKYGKTVTTNAETENELTYIGYFLPAGEYIAKNNRQYPGQVNVYSSETKMDDGIEYPVETSAYLIPAGESKQITVPEGWYVKLVPPEDFTLTPVD